MNNVPNQEKYFPMLVADINEDDVIFLKRWEKYKILPIKTQDLLTDDGLVRFIYGAEQRYHLSDEQTEDFSRTVRQYYFREVTEGGFAKKVAEICRVSPDDALKLLKAINAITPGQAQKKQQSKNISKMTFDAAIAKYPGILQQVITQKSIISKPFLKPLKPTVKNWILIYEKILDVSKHDMIERGEFVYRAEATRGISEQERRRLLMLFKSRDEGSELEIDVDAQEIVFEREEKISEKTLESSQNNDRVVLPQQKPVEKRIEKNPQTQNKGQQKRMDDMRSDQRDHRKEQVNLQNNIPLKHFTKKRNVGIIKFNRERDSIGDMRSDQEEKIQENKITHHTPIQKEKPIEIEKKNSQDIKNTHLQPQKGFFGTDTYLQKEEDQLIKPKKLIKDYKNIKLQPVYHQQKSVGENILKNEDLLQMDHKKNEDMPVPHKDEVLKNAAGEIEFFVKNIQKRPLVREKTQSQINEDGKRIIGSEEFKLKKDDHIDHISDQEKNRLIAKEKEELEKATKKLESLIASMQESVRMQRSIGVNVKDQRVFKSQNQKGDLKKEIEKNKEELYGIQVDESVQIDDEIEKLEMINEKNPLERKIIFEDGSVENIDEKGEQVRDEHMPKNTSLGNVVFTSNHLLPSEKDLEKKQTITKNLFSMSPIGMDHKMHDEQGEKKEKKEENV